MQTEITQTKNSLLQVHGELDSLKELLAVEKMARASAEADLDAAKSKKPDTSEADALREELQTLKTKHQAAVLTAQEESAKATQEYQATKAALEKAESELAQEKAEIAEKAKAAEND